MAVEQRILESVHIEKTAGNTALEFLNSTFGTEHILHYNPITDSLVQNTRVFFTDSRVNMIRQKLNDSRFRPLIARMYCFISSEVFKPSLVDPGNLPPNTKAIHGHFRADRFDNVIEDPIRMVIIREPYVKMRSHFINWKRSRGTPEWRVRIPYNPDLCFEDFSLLPEMIDYQTNAIAGKSLDEFELVGTTENIAPW